MALVQTTGAQIKTPLDLTAFTGYVSNVNYNLAMSTMKYPFPSSTLRMDDGVFTPALPSNLYMGNIQAAMAVRALLLSTGTLFANIVQIIFKGKRFYVVTSAVNSPQNYARVTEIGDDRITELADTRITEAY